MIQRWRTLSAIEYRWGFFFVKYLIIVTFVRSRSFCS
nr:MAG TPA: Leader protein [Caudoviricetes sp.]DAO46279.1 MAG TPA: Leader protein [Bacteriophage sp.]